jgi:hypothetical protein
VAADLEPVIARYRERGVELYFRADAAFAKPEIYERLEAEGMIKVDAALLSRLPAQRRAAPAPCARLQPRQTPAHVSPAGGGRALVAHDTTREAGQDRRQGCASRPVRRVPAGRSRGATCLFAEILRRIDRLRSSPLPLLA